MMQWIKHYPNEWENAQGKGVSRIPREDQPEDPLLIRLNNGLYAQLSQFPTFGNGGARFDGIPPMPYEVTE